MRQGDQLAGHQTIEYIQSIKLGGAMKVLLWIVGGLLGAFTALVIVSAVHESGNPKTTMERIEESCQQEFGDRGQLAVDECRLRTTMRLLRDREKAKDDAAYGRVR